MITKNTKPPYIYDRNMDELLDEDNLKIKGLFLHVAIMLSILYFLAANHTYHPRGTFLNPAKFQIYFLVVLYHFHEEGLDSFHFLNNCFRLLNRNPPPSTQSNNPLQRPPTTSTPTPFNKTSEKCSKHQDRYTYKVFGAALNIIAITHFPSGNSHTVQLKQQRLQELNKSNYNLSEVNVLTNL